MARVTVEDCLKKLDNRFDLVLVSSIRSRELATGGKEPYVDWENDKPTVVALREIAEGFVDRSILLKKPNQSQGQSQSHQSQPVVKSMESFGKPSASQEHEAISSELSNSVNASTESSQNNSASSVPLENTSSNESILQVPAASDSETFSTDLNANLMAELARELANSESSSSTALGNSEPAHPEESHSSGSSDTNEPDPKQQDTPS